MKKNVYKKMSEAQLRKIIQKQATKANRKLAVLGEFAKYNNVMARKYIPILEGTGKKFTWVRTKDSKFSNRLGDDIAKEDLIDYIELLNVFITNPFTTKKYTIEQLDKMGARYGLNRDEIMTMFDVYREFGLDNYVQESTEILMNLGEISASSPHNLRDVVQFIEDTLSMKPGGYDIEEFNNYLTHYANIDSRDSDWNDIN